MRCFLLILAAILLNFNAQAGRKFLIETNKLINNVSLIDSKIGSITRLIPGHNDKMRFLFEIESIDNFYLQFPSSLLIKLYSLSDKVESDWRPVNEDEKVPIKSFFTKTTAKNIVLDDFMLKNFISNPLAGSEGTLRGNSIFYTQDKAIFGSPGKLSIAWKSQNQIIELKLYDLTNDYTAIYSTRSYNDSVLLFKILPESVKDKLNQKSTYCLSITTENACYGYSENHLSFSFDSLHFIHQSGNMYFIDEQEIDINWDTPEKESIVKVYDDEKNLVFNTLTTKKSLNFIDFGNIPFKYKKPYKIEITLENKTISKCFYILFGYQDYTKLK